MTRLHFSLENDRAAFRRELEARVTGAVVQLSAAVSVPKLAAPSAGRERLRRLTSSNVISRQHGTFQGTGACIRKPMVLMSSHFASCRGLRY